MPRKHPIFAVTGSSGAGTTTVKAYRLFSSVSGPGHSRIKLILLDFPMYSQCAHQPQDRLRVGIST